VPTQPFARPHQRNATAKSGPSFRPDVTLGAFFGFRAIRSGLCSEPLATDSCGGLRRHGDRKRCLDGKPDVHNRCRDGRSTTTQSLQPLLARPCNSHVCDVHRGCVRSMGVRGLDRRAAVPDRQSAFDGRLDRSGTGRYALIPASTRVLLARSISRMTAGSTCGRCTATMLLTILGGWPARGR
jgi:hypothetical protein